MMKLNKNLEELAEMFLGIKTRKEMYDFLQGILTPKELLEISNRLQIVKMLKRGISHHDIAGKLHVGVATVTRGSRELREGRFKNV
ncbi:MAG: Trp repressor [Candidatus Nomurabacteria bacterium GW2011_GWA1_37_20]|uniref:Trp repressor n=1 Tax=Candidatus Nomurabacteria bacterium GW2011_GWA1_37_20 TaxID=1618729 RepID=A0A0G0JAD4_9BACT|nr:MAG: Trp repressor [Candidatus Nomurabacteria bacterium GW2011_GWA1_37_20]KKQ38053.1 MAG: Trp repressor [Candidatus Levybacteria bacterium GW2011_GWC2_37_7]KKQ42883.1 MAG: Trp repressor [Candidatus Levybacteria bacterium GW2011_GWB1_37_8]